MEQPSAVMHSTLAYVSLDRDLNLGTQVSALTNYHRTAAIRKIREMMDSDSADNLTALAGAVVLLLAAEVSASIVNTYEPVLIHCNAISHSKAMSRVLVLICTASVALSIKLEGWKPFPGM
jgi:hypothetical protein